MSVTRDCNLRCKYCFEDHKDDFHGEKMSWTTFKTLIDRIASDKRKSGNPLEIELSFHGGEPTLLGVRDFVRFAEYAKKVLSKVDFSMQSNLTLIDRNWLRVLKKYQVGLGGSLDGTNFQDNSLRTGRSYREQLQLLQKHGQMPGLILVVSKTNIDRYEQIRAEFQKMGVNGVRANRMFILPQNQKLVDVDQQVSGREYFEKIFLSEMVFWQKTGELFETNTKHLVERFLGQLHSKILGKEFSKSRRSLCSVKFCGGGSFMVDVTADGNLAYCQRWSKDCGERIIGNISDQDLWGLSSYRRVLSVKKIPLDFFRRHCDNCFASDICSHGCFVVDHQKNPQKFQTDRQFYCDLSQRVKKYFQKNALLLLYLELKRQQVQCLPNGERYLVFRLPKQWGLPQKGFNPQPFKGLEILQQDEQNYWLQFDQRLIEQMSLVKKGGK